MQFGLNFVPKMKYAEEEKRAAIALYITEGATAAAASVGCTRQAIYSWLGHYGVDAVNDEEKRLATITRRASKREALAEAFLDQSLTLLLAADESQPLDAQRLMTAAAIASQKFTELAGGPPSASSFVLTSAVLEDEISRLEGERRARSPVDTELERMAGEMHRQVQSKFFEEVDKELAASVHQYPPERVEVMRRVIDRNGHLEPPEEVL